MRHSFIDRYAGLGSVLHALDARSKLIGFTALIVAILMTPPERESILFAYYLLLTVLAGVSQIPLNFILARTVVILPFLMLAGLAATWRAEGGASVLIFLLRSVFCLVMLILLTNTTRFAELLRGLRRLGCPRVLAMNLGFLYRYFFVLTEEILRMRQARDCRRVGRPRLATELRSLGSMLGTLLLRSFERAERMYQAMLSRGYSGDFPVHAGRRFGLADVGFLAGVALWIAWTSRA